MFVDDEARILAGLRRMLHPMNREWEMFFCEGGAAALEQLRLQAVDVIVSDIRMPRIDGVQLFTEIARLYPRTVRIALSGQTSEEAMMRAVGAAHQFLSKPCDAAILRSTVTRICDLQRLLASEDLRALVAQMENLPPLPALHTELLAAVQAPQATVRSVARVIAKDMAMTAKLLQLVNSAFFGVQHRVSDPVEAVNRLGLDTMRNLALSMGVFARPGHATLPHLSMERLWDHSLRVSLLARGLCELEGADHPTAEDAATGGMLHDVGKVILATGLGMRYDEVLERAAGSDARLAVTEAQALGCTHTQVGAYLLGIWGLPTTIVEAVAYHHDLQDYLTDRFSAVLAVHAADLLTHEAEDGVALADDDPVLRRLCLSDHLQVWRCFQREHGRKAA